jgi:hypothetical protein
VIGSACVRPLVTEDPAAAPMGKNRLLLLIAGLAVLVALGILTG